jgi:hypothetical protein
MKLAEIKDGVVVNIIVVDPSAIPDWCADWPTAVGDVRIGSAYTDGVFLSQAINDPPAPTIGEIRAQMVCSPMQGKLALGQAEWSKIESYRDIEATWAQRVVIDSAQEWRRLSEDIQFFGYLLQYTDEQMDALFIAAMQISA